MIETQETAQIHFGYSFLPKDIVFSITSFTHHHSAKIRALWKAARCRHRKRFSAQVSAYPCPVSPIYGSVVMILLFNTVSNVLNKAIITTTKDPLSVIFRTQVDPY